MNNEKQINIAENMKYSWWMIETIGEDVQKTEVDGSSNLLNKSQDS